MKRENCGWVEKGNKKYLNILELIKLDKPRENNLKRQEKANRLWHSVKTSCWLSKID